MAVGGPPVASRCRCVFTWQTPALRLWLARGILLGLVCVVLTSALQAYAGPAIPGLHSAFGRVTPPAPNTVPQARELVRGVKALEMPGASRLVVHQDERRAVIDWQSFDIGSDAAVHFDQRGNADWEALNRIFDQNPSQIFGQLTADGKVFLINPNGILFAPDAKVNLHALVASALNLDIDDFDIGLQRFTAPDGQAPGPVANYGTIETDSLGSVVLIGADAENGGRIVAPSGKVALVAGDTVRIASDGSGGLAVTRTTGAGEDGVASNREGGEIQTDSGWTGMFGRLVNQDGMIQAVTAIRRNGQIVLAADETVATGPYSTTTSPVSDSDEAEHESFGFSGGHIDVIAARIEHRGEISAPSGTINLSANERIYLDAGSRVDVSGNWVDEPASRNVVQAQLNSVELRDDYGQKGRVLQGATVSVDVREGSAVGDVSGHLTAEELTAEERSTTGGIIQMTRPANDFILRAGGTLDFAGGGFRFQEGQVETTKLLSGQRLYDLSEAPQWLHYDALLDRQETVHARYGVVDEFTGLYTGGAAPLKDYSTAYVQGSDAGQLLLMARHVVLDGDLLGGVVRGYYQTEVEEADGAVGKREPVGGILTIGGGELVDPTTPQDTDFITGDVAIVADGTVLPADFDPADALPETTTLSSSQLNDAGLSALTIRSNTRIEIASDANLHLESGGTLQVVGRAIDQRGEIHVPSGSVGFVLDDNLTSSPTLPNGESNDAYVPLSERARLAAGSLITTAGERVDNSTADNPAGKPIRAARIDGGEVAILDQINDLQGAVLVEPGAEVDVSGGFQIDGHGDVAGGDGGSLIVQGATLVAQGDLRGHAVTGRSGGAVSLRAGETVVTALSPSAPGAFNQGKLVVAGDRFVDSGFSHIDLGAVHDVTVKAGAKITPSRVHLAMPVAGAATAETSQVRNSYVTSGAAGDRDGLITVPPEEAGGTSVSLTAGRTFVGLTNVVDADTEAITHVASGATIEVAPEGSVALVGPTVAVEGRVIAPAGEVALEAGQRDLVVGGEARILAQGYNRPEYTPVADGLAASLSPEPGGSVTLAANNVNGNVRVLPGAVVDVSGSTPVHQLVPQGDGTLTSFADASTPGRVAISSGGSAEIAGDLIGWPGLEGLPGGTFTLATTGSHSDPSTGLLVGLTVNDELVSILQNGGFDDLTFRSFDTLWLARVDAPAVGRHLTLDAPVIQGAGSRTVSLDAPWIRLMNSSNNATSIAPVPGSADTRLNLHAEFIDVDGNLTLGGFEHILLSAARDIRLTDRTYNLGGGTQWLGRLATNAEQLTLEAGRIYPTTLSRYTVASQGRVTTLPNGFYSGPPPSAGATLAIEADEIQHGGVLAAPFGTVTLGSGVTTRTDDGVAVRVVTPADRVYLAPGSVITTSGDLSVRYGRIQDERIWTVPDKANAANAPLPIDGPPARSVTVAADELVFDRGATIDVSGGGSLYTYQFLSSTAGTDNPLDLDGRQVILPGGDPVFPGPAVYLDGTEGVPSGTYSLLPEEFAFLPGAYVIQPLSGDYTPGGNQVSAEGYPLVTGYETEVGTSLRSPGITTYTLRPAAEVLQEGTFLQPEALVAGAAGTIRLTGDTNLVNGTIDGTAIAGYAGGSLALAGQEITVGPVAGSVSGGTRVGDLVPAELVGRLNFDPASVAGQSLREIILGDTENTRSVTVAGGGIAGFSRVTLAARDEIHVTAGAEIQAEGDGAQAFLLSPTGRITIDDGAVVHASDNITLDGRQIDLLGLLQVDHSSLSLAADRILVLPDDDVAGLPDGLYLTQSLWQGFRDLSGVNLVGRSEIDFLGGMEIPVLGTLTVDTPRLRGDTGGADVHLTGDVIHLRNTTDGVTAVGESGDGTLAVAVGRELRIGGGDVSVDGFSSLSLESGGDMVFQGHGSLTTNVDTVLAAPRITAGNAVTDSTDGSLDIDAPDFLLAAGTGDVTIAPATAPATAATTYGGRLTIRGDNIEHHGRIELPGGDVALEASGSGAGQGIFLREGATLAARGTVVNHTLTTGDVISVPMSGGTIRLAAPAGTIQLDAGSTIDVSADGGPGAGGVSLIAPQHGVTVAGELSGHGPAGNGGDVQLASDDGAALDPLLQLLAAGGFDGTLGLRFATANRAADEPAESKGGPAKNELVVSRDIEAAGFDLSIDTGSLSVVSTIDVTGPTGGGDIRLASGGKLTLAKGGRLEAAGGGAGAPGGTVDLRAAAGELALDPEAPLLTVDPGSVIDVSAGAGGNPGRVTLRAPRTDDRVLMALGGTVTGAGEILAEGTRTYTAADLKTSVTIGASGPPQYSIVADDLDTWKEDTDAFMADGRALRDPLFASLQASGTPATHLLPGIEVAVDSDLTLAAPLDLTSWRFADEPGVLTLRAGGDLHIDQSIIDHPTEPLVLPGTSGRDSWEVVAVAGAAPGAADLLAVEQAAGDLALADGAVVYSESAPITLVAGGDVRIGTGGTSLPYMIRQMNYAVGSYDAPLQVEAGSDVYLAGGAIQAATGAIDVSAAGDVLLTAVGSDVGAIRTTGQPTPLPDVPPDFYFLIYSDYAGGGDIAVAAGGTITGALNGTAWDTLDLTGAWSASYETAGSNRPTQGIAAMGGGSVTLDAASTVDVQAGTFGAGDLQITAGGDVDGRFLVDQGDAEIFAGGNFGRKRPGTPVEAFDATVAITALGNVDLGTVVNPTIARSGFDQASQWNLGYGPNSAVVLTALAGDVAIAGDSRFYGTGGPTNRERLLPPHLAVRADRDITVGNHLALAPAADGNLSLVAGRDIDGERSAKLGNRTASLMTKINVSDLDPAAVFGVQEDPTLIDQLFRSSEHGTTLLHAADPVPVEVRAGQDLHALYLGLPKAAEIQAGRDIVDIYYDGQNVQPEDVSLIQAQRDLIFGASGDFGNDTGIQHGGPGFLLVQAGESIDLGVSADGIQAVGNQFNLTLPAAGSTVAVTAGTTTAVDEAGIVQFFSELQGAGSDFSRLLTQAETYDLAQERIALARTEVIHTFFGDTELGAGAVNMTRSKISTTGAGGDLYIVATGDVNVGRSTFGNVGSTGIFTAAGGDISVYANGDLNVNESRLMTYFGGDITVWSDTGDINAGRGAKTAVSAEPPHLQPVGDEYILVFTPPAVGSGIRTLTFDPDGADGPGVEPVAGDVALFAPQGVIDAGEAGIAAANITLGATEVLNAENISFSVGSVGVPATGAAAVSLGAVAGVSGLSEAATLGADAAALGAGDERLAQEAAALAEAFSPRWLKVEFLDYGEDHEDDDHKKDHK